MTTERELFHFLDQLRDSGRVNMFYAKSQLMETFDMPPIRAGEIIWKWLQTYSERHPGKRAVE